MPQLVKENFLKELSVFVFFFIFWFGLFYFTGHLYSGYHLIDDHQIITLNEKLQTNSLPAVIKDYIKFDGRFRFRFLFPVHRVIMTKVLGFNITLWSVYIGLLCVLTSFFLYRFCLISGFTRMQSLLFSLLTLAGVQAAIWYQSADAENLGMLFLSLTLMFLAKNIYNDKNKRLNKICFAVCLVLMCLSKESFVLMIPAVLFLYILLYGNKKNINLIQSVKDNKYLIIIPASQMFSFLFYIILFVGIDKTGQTGVDSRIFSLFFIREFIYTMRHYTVFLIILFGVIILFDHKISENKDSTIKGSLKETASDLLNVTILFLLIIIPQFTLYYKSGMRDRYFLPFILGFAYFIVYLLRQIFDSKNISGTIKYLYLSMILFLLMFEIRANVITYMTKFADDSISSNLMLGSIISGTGKDAPILAIIDPISSYEQGRSFLVYLKSLGGKDKIYFDFAKKDYITDSFSDSSFSKISELATKVYLRDNLLDSLTNKYDIECVAIFPKLEKKFLDDNKDWFDKDNFTREEFELYTVYFKK